jgi:hypothetical protein
MSESKADRQNEEAQNPSDDSLRGQSLQDHERVKAEQDGTATHSDPSVAPLSRDKALEEVRQVRADNEERTRRHSTVAIEREVAASSPSGRSDVKPIEVRRGTASCTSTRTASGCWTATRSWTCSTPSRRRSRR